MTFQQLKPLPVQVIGQGKGVSIGVIDDGPDHALIWITALDASGEIIRVPNDQVRLLSDKPEADRFEDASPDADAARPFEAPVWDGTEAQHRALPMPGADAEHSAYP
jgi:hypothetical protein